MKSAVIIPARWDSSRFPGKPLKMISGVSMLERVYRLAASSCSRVIIATDDKRIAEASKGFGAEAVMTSSTCSNGTERVFEAATKLNLKDHNILNLQGDAVLTPPWVLSELLTACESGNSFVTPARLISNELVKKIIQRRSKGITTGTFVVVDKDMDALYFSKQPLPFVRDGLSSAFTRLHIGLYAYTYEMLSKFCSLEPTPLEMAEKLEQLRALENGIKLRVVDVDYQGRTHHSVDQPEDIAVVEEIIAREGELL